MNYELGSIRNTESTYVIECWVDDRGLGLDFGEHTAWAFVGTELFDLETVISAARNIIAHHPSAVATLTAAACRASLEGDQRTAIQLATAACIVGDMEDGSAVGTSVDL